MYVSEKNQLCFILPYSPMRYVPKQFAYFVKRPAQGPSGEDADGAMAAAAGGSMGEDADGQGAQNEPVSIATVSRRIQFGQANGGGLDSLLRVMRGVYSPQLLQGKSNLPGSVRREVAGELHRFMASLVEAAHQAQGKTMLYVPPEAVPEDPQEAAADDELVQRLGAIVMHWTRQIRDVTAVSGAEGTMSPDEEDTTAASRGLLLELDFWSGRCDDLSGVTGQLRSGDVRRIAEALRAAASPHLAPFEARAAQIMAASGVAEENLKFLGVLRGVSERLEVAGPDEVPALLPEVLSRIRFVTEHCKYYASSERVSGLLVRVSDAVVARCRVSIDLDELFDGSAVRAAERLQTCVQCLDAWRTEYARVAAVARLGRGPDAQPWRPNLRAVFARANAFRQRCIDLRAICEGLQQFARRTSEEDGRAQPLPRFGGQRGREVVADLSTIEQQFLDVMREIKARRGSLLSIQAPHWYQINAYFKSRVKDLEVMMTNSIHSAFEGTTRIPDCAALLEAFDSLAIIPRIKRAVHQKAQEVWALFLKQLRDAKSIFDAQAHNPPLRPDEPMFAGAALWTEGIARPLREDMAVLDRLTFLEDCPERAEAKTTHMEHQLSYQSHCESLCRRWKDQLAGAGSAEGINDRLHQSLLQKQSSPQDKEKDKLTTLDEAGDGAIHITRTAKVTRDRSTGYLQSNFDEGLQKLFNEVHGWQKFGGRYTVPFAAVDLKNNRMDALRKAQEQVMLVVRAYNGIVDSLRSDERPLFAFAVKKLDRSILPGLSRVRWDTDPGPRELFLRQARARCLEMQAAVDEFHRLRKRAESIVKEMDGTALAEIEKHYVYDQTEFRARQAKCQEDARRALLRLHDEQRKVMTGMYAFFRPAPVSVQTHWVRYVRGLDQQVGRALHGSVKRSLTMLHRAICGDPKADGQMPLFRVNLLLENKRLDYSPTMMELQQMLGAVQKQLTTVIMVVPRLLDVLPLYIKGYKASRAALEAAA